MLGAGGTIGKLGWCWPSWSSTRGARDPPAPLHGDHLCDSLKPMTEQVLTVLFETAGFDPVEVRALHPHERFDEFLAKPDFNNELTFEVGYGSTLARQHSTRSVAVFLWQKGKRWPGRAQLQRSSRRTSARGRAVVVLGAIVWKIRLRQELRGAQPVDLEA